MKYILFFIISFLIIYLVYFLFVVNPFIKELKPKKKKKNKNKKIKRNKKLPADILIFTSYFGIDHNKVGLIRMMRILNFVNALIMSVLITIVLPIKKIWLQIIILAVLIIPVIWFVYMLLAKYFRYLERKSENV